MTLINAEILGFGGITITAEALDATMTSYLPSSVRKLREIAEERAAADFSRIDTLTEFLFLLADMDHNHDNSPYRSY